MVQNLEQPWDNREERAATAIASSKGISGQYFYNKTLLKKAGFDPEKPPKTWQEMEQVAEKLTVADQLGVDMMDVDLIQTGADLSGAFVSWLYTNNGKFVSDDAKTLLFNSPEGVETLEWMVNFTKTYYGGIENVREFWKGANPASSDYPFG